MPQGKSSPADRRARPETRDRIVEAATQVFAEKGYYAASVDDIVRASETSKGSFYHFFPSKQGIFLALVDLLQERLMQRVTTAVEQERGALGKVEGAVGTVLREFARHRRIARILLIEAAGLGHAFNKRLFDLHTTYAEWIRRYLDRAVEEGSIPPLDTELAAYAWLGALHEIVMRWLHTGRPEPLESALPELRALLLRSVGVVPEPVAEPSAGPQA